MKENIIFLPGQSNKQTKSDFLPLSRKLPTENIQNLGIINVFERISLRAKGYLEKKLPKALTIVLIPTTGGLHLSIKDQVQTVTIGQLAILPTMHDAIPTIKNIIDDAQSQFLLIGIKIANETFQLHEIDRKPENTFGSAYTIPFSDFTFQFGFFNTKSEFLLQRQKSPTHLFYVIAGVFEVQERLLVDDDCVFLSLNEEIEMMSFEGPGIIMLLNY